MVNYYSLIDQRKMFGRTMVNNNHSKWMTIVWLTKEKYLINQGQLLEMDNYYSLEHQI